LKLYKNKKHHSNCYIHIVYPFFFTLVNIQIFAKFVSFRLQRYVEYPKLPNLFAEKSQSTLSEFSNSQIGFPLRAAELNLLDNKNTTGKTMNCEL